MNDETLLQLGPTFAVTPRITICGRRVQSHDARLRLTSTARCAIFSSVDTACRLRPLWVR
jgi:hypothetical protein